MGKFDIRDYNEDISNKETRKDQKIRHQLFDKRTGRIAKEKKASQRIPRMTWDESDAES